MTHLVWMLRRTTSLLRQAFRAGAKSTTGSGISGQRQHRQKLKEVNHGSKADAHASGGCEDSEVPSKNAATDGGRWQDTLTASWKPVAVQRDQDSGVAGGKRIGKGCGDGINSSPHP